MADLTAQEMAERLVAGQFQHSGPDARALSDPIADTPMIVTLDQLRPYDLNPRVTRNPRYDDIKASIRTRHLDAPPPITRRPGESHFIIRNGGNTRLAILNELWSETKDESFFRFACLFRPWAPRGEIVTLTGHLAENELRGSLSFIERALGVEKARELYQQESGEPLSQRELARRLTADGYPIAQSQISRMQDTVRYLLPAIPSVLYSGLGRPQIERLIALRQAASRAWERHASKRSLTTDLPALFHDVLTGFDTHEATFSVERVQDELIGQLSQVLVVDYDALVLEIVDVQARQHVLTQDPTEASNTTSHGQTVATRVVAPPGSESPVQATTRTMPVTAELDEPGQSHVHSRTVTRTEDANRAVDAGATPHNERLQAHIVSAAETTDRLQTIQRRIADATGESLPDFNSNVVQAIPVQAGGLHPIADVWYIEPALDAPDRLRVHIAQLAREIAQEAQLAERIESIDEGIGFICTSGSSESPSVSLSAFARGVLSLLHALSSAYASTPHGSSLTGVRLLDDLGPLLQGPPLRSPQTAVASTRLSDAGVVKLYRLIRLARRSLELEHSDR